MLKEKMKKKVFLLCLILTLFFEGLTTHFVVYATPETSNVQETTPVATEGGFKDAKELKEKVEKKLEEIKEKVATKQAAVKERFSETRRKRILGFWQRMLKRLQSALSRLEKISARIASRIEKFKEQEVDTAEAEEKLVLAKDEITLAKATLSEAETQFEQIFTADDPKAIFIQVRGLVGEVKDSLKSAHQALVAAVVALKGAGATPTP